MLNKYYSIAVIIIFIVIINIAVFLVVMLGPTVFRRKFYRILPSEYAKFRGLLAENHSNFVAHSIMVYRS